MQRITTATRVVNKHGPGRDGFGDGNPTTGTPSTQLEANWFDQAQEEIARVIERANMVLDPGNLEQLYEAILFHIGAAGGGAFVLKAGDTMTGNLVVNGAVQAVHLQSSGDVVATASLRSGYVESSGDIRSVGNTHSNGSIFGATIQSFGNIFADGSVIATFQISGASANFTGHVNGTTAGFSGNLYGGDVSTGAGGLYSAGTIYAEGNITTAAQAINFGGSNQASLFSVPFGPAALRFMGVHPGFHQLGLTSYGANLTYNTPGLPDGGGAWSCSDGGGTQQPGPSFASGHFPNILRTPDTLRHSPWVTGLAEVLRIVPRKIDDNNRSSVFAEELEEVLPEAVHTYTRQVTDDTTSEEFAVDNACILYACVNAIKELHAEIQTLKGGSSGITLPA